MPWLLTWRTYATHQALAKRDGRPVVSPSHAPFFLNAPCREAVLRAIRQTCDARGWHLYAAHVRTNHVHVVLDTADSLPTVFAALKAGPTKALRAAGLIPAAQPVWADYRHIGKLVTPAAVESAVRYVLDRQGRPLHRWPEP